MSWFYISKNEILSFEYADTIDDDKVILYREDGTCFAIGTIHEDTFDKLQEAYGTLIARKEKQISLLKKQCQDMEDEVWRLKCARIRSY